MPIAKTIFKNKIKYSATAKECLKNADCALLVTEWSEFKKLAPEDFEQSMQSPFLIDGRRIYDSKKFSRRMKFKTIGLG